MTDATDTLVSRRRTIATIGGGIIAALAGCTNGSSTNNDGSINNDGSGSGTDPVFAPREEFEYNGVTYTALDVAIDDRLYIGTREYGAGQGAELVRVRLRMENNGDESIRVPLLEDVDPVLVDGQGREYERQRTIVSAEEIGPGLSERALFYFEVPVDQETRQLVIGSASVRLIETATPTETPTQNPSETPTPTSTTEEQTSSQTVTETPSGEANISINNLQVTRVETDDSETDIRVIADVEYSWNVLNTTRRIVKLLVGPNENDLELLTFQNERDPGESGSGTLSFDESLFNSDTFAQGDFEDGSQDIVVGVEIEVRRPEADPLTTLRTEKKTV